MMAWVLSGVYYEPDDDEQAERVIQRIKGVIDDEGITSYTIMTNPDPFPARNATLSDLAQRVLLEGPYEKFRAAPGTTVTYTDVSDDEPA